MPLTALGLGLLLACARMGPPVGGPDDKVAPVLVRTIPDSLAVFPGWKQDVEFRFDEVISEGSSPNQGTGTGDLEKLILVSPSTGVPVIHWKRDRITVKPRDGWQPNRVYRIQLLAGITDLRRNRSDTTTVVTFSTGAPLPTDTLSGIVVDWPQGQVAKAALVEMVLLPDSLVYRTLSDSSGRFRVGPLPRGRWIVYAAVDQNHNLQRERRESYDSLPVAPGDTASLALWTIPRDTLGPRIQTVSVSDSTAATVTFSQPLDPTQRFDSLAVRLLLQADSSVVPVRSLLPQKLDDSLQAELRARQDSLKAAADTARPDSAARRQQPPRPPERRGPPSQKVRDEAADSLIASRPALFDKLILRPESPFPPDTRYQLEIRGIRAVSGVAGDARNGFVTPKPRPVASDSTTAVPDSTAAPGDSTRAGSNPAAAPKP